VTVPCLKFLTINQLEALISQIYSWNGTLHVSDSSSVHHQEFSTVHTAMLYVIQVCWQLASRIRMFYPDPALCMTYTIAMFTMKNSWWRTEELSETCRIQFQEYIWKINASSWFVIRNFCKFSNEENRTFQLCLWEDQFLIYSLIFAKFMSQLTDLMIVNCYLETMTVIGCGLYQELSALLAEEYERTYLKPSTVYLS
jgi:hypothetical protein